LAQSLKGDLSHLDEGGAPGVSEILWTANIVRIDDAEWSRSLGSCIFVSDDVPMVLRGVIGAPGRAAAARYSDLQARARDWPVSVERIPLALDTWAAIESPPKAVTCSCNCSQLLLDWGELALESTRLQAPIWRSRSVRGILGGKRQRRLIPSLDSLQSLEKQ
jgi:hypothetical protein